MLTPTQLRPAIRALYVTAIIALLTTGLVPWSQWSRRYFGSDFGTLNLLWLQGALVLAALGLLVVYGWASKSTNQLSNKVLLHPLLIVLIFHASCVIVQLGKSLEHKVPYTRTEEIVLLSSLASDGLVDLYSVSNLSHPPFKMGLYGPLFYAVEGPILRSGGPASFRGRWVSVIAILFVAGLLSTKWLEVPHPVYRLTAPLLFLSMFGLLAWSVSLLKPEFMAGCLSLSGLLVFMKRGLNARKRWVIPAAMLFACALLTKISIFAGFAAVATHLALAKRFKECLSLVLLVLFLVVVVYAGLWVATGGGVWLMTVEANAVRLTPSRMFELGINETLGSTLGTVMIVAGVILLMRCRGKPVDQVVVLFFAIAIATFLLATSRPGATRNYFFEAAIAGAMVLGALIASYLKSQNDHALTLLFVVLTVGMLTLIPRAAFGTATASDDPAARGHVAKALSNLTVGADEYVLADEAFVLELWQARIPLLMIGSVQYTVMTDSGVLDTKSLMTPLVEGKVPYLVINATPEAQLSAPYGKRGWPVEVLEYLKKNYKCSQLEIVGASDRGPFICDYSPKGSERGK